MSGLGSEHWQSIVDGSPKKLQESSESNIKSRGILSGYA